MAESQVSSESSPVIEQILSDPEFQTLARRKASLSLLLTVVTMVCYFAFVGLLAFGREALAAPFGSATRGIPFGIGVIILGWIVTGIYVRWANSTYDTAVAQLRAKHFPGRSSD